MDTIALTGFICAGLARLARFNATAALKPGKASFFEGLPIPSSLGLVGVMAYWVYRDWVGADLPLGTTCLGETKKGVLGGGKCEWGEMHWLSLVFGVWAAMMVSKTLKVPKL